MNFNTSPATLDPKVGSERASKEDPMAYRNVCDQPSRRLRLSGFGIARASIVLYGTVVMFGTLVAASELDLETLADIDVIETQAIDVHTAVGIHRHYADEFMVSYKVKHMSMAGNLKGTSNLSVRDVLDTYLIAPEAMTMTMHMLGVMYAPSDRVTLMAMVPFVDLEMDHVTRSGSRFTAESKGPGDAGIGSVISWNTGIDIRHTFGLHNMLTLPTGSISKRGVTPMSGGNSIQLPYPMQIGSGSVGVDLAGAYFGEAGKFGWGGEAGCLFFLHKNDRGYRVGNRYRTDAWFAYGPVPELAFTVPLRGFFEADFSGADASLNADMVPTADPDLRRKTTISSGVGFTTLVTGSWLEGVRVSGEFLAPIYQNVDGPQLEMDFKAAFALQYVFQI